MRSKKALINISISLILQLITIISGFIVPRLIIGTFGSDVNGIISSISQFLGYIVLLESGIGGVTRAALYKPLVNKDTDKISGIIKATEDFFKKIAKVFLAYTFIIALVYPFIVKEEFNYFYTFTLVIIIGISSFVQYYFGITYQILLKADQKVYISSFLQILTVLLNTIIVFLFIRIGASIHIVKLMSAIVYVIRPILLNNYVKSKYKIKKDISPNNNAIKQRWDGLGHHIAYFLHNHTDMVILTIFTNVKEVSVYSIYYMVLSGIQRLINTFSSGIEAAFGNMIAKNEKESLKRNFGIYGFVSFIITTTLFTATAILIIPFVKIYTKGVVDANYIRPLFAYVLILAEAFYCIRIPYHSVVMAAGHFKQTKKIAFLEALINIVISMFLVNLIGITGVAVGTLIAVLIRTVYYALYLSENFIKGTFLNFNKRLLINCVAVVLTISTVGNIPEVMINSFTIWIKYAFIVTVITFLVTLTFNVIFFYIDFKNLITLIRNVLTKRV